MTKGAWDLPGLTQLGQHAGGFQDIPTQASGKTDAAADFARGCRVGGLQTVGAMGEFAAEWKWEFSKHGRALQTVGDKLVSTARIVGTADQHTTNEFDRVPMPTGGMRPV